MAIHHQPKVGFTLITKKVEQKPEMASAPLIKTYNKRGKAEIAPIYLNDKRLSNE